MVEEIYELKNKLLKRAEQDTQNIERFDIKAVGEIVDMIKDLAEAEKCCWEAQYYRRVTEAMEGSSGYSTTGNPASGGGNIPSGSRQGYSQPMRYGYGMMGHDDLIGKLTDEYNKLGPDERMMMKNRIFTELGK